MKRFTTLLCALLTLPSLTRAESIPAHGSYSTNAATKWESAFVSGNGRMGAMMFGNPTNDTIIANHCRLFLPLGNREIVPDLAQYVPELRRTIREKNYGEGMKFFLSKAKEQGYPGLIPTDPYHPGLFVNVRQPATGAIADYARTEDFQTGEVVTRWRDDRGQFQRRMFVSRADNLIVVSLNGPAPVELQFPPVNHALIQSQQETSADWVTYHNTYTKGKGGYDAAVRIVHQDGKAEVAGDTITITGAREVLLFIRIVPWKTPQPKETSEAWAYSPDNPDFKKAGVFKPAPALAESSVVAYRQAEDAAKLMPALKKSLAGLRDDYARLFAPHAKLHGELFNRVTLDIGGGAERTLTTETLLEIAKQEGRLPAALMEKMYDAGRYMFICSAGELLPNLHGIWNGTWKPAWSGDFTLDTNVQAAMASACSANLAELLEGYFRLMESFYPEWRINAKRTYGCRGFFSNARASNTCLLLHWGTWQGVFWTAGSGWLASFFTDYAQYTGDREFLEKRCVPLLKEIAVFYEDFLSETNQSGRVEFIPSYNPETGCGLSATMDIAVAREVLGNLITACRELKIERDNLPRWEALLKKLPDYPINQKGELAEWPDGRVVPGHRHHSQLYPCFQSFDPLFETTPELRQAAQATVRVKIAASDAGGKGNEQSSFGRIQSGVSAAYLGMPEEAYGRLQVMAVKRSMNPSLITSHEPNAGIFNTNGNGGIPQIANTMLVHSRMESVELLPALPAAWPAGAIQGLRIRGGCTVDLQWAQGKLVAATLHPERNLTLTVRYQGKSVPVRLSKGKAQTLNADLN
ncbi:MAG: glycoside hydrolase N-terminal domain-containing protein [Verrucomicrobiota bacterium]